MTLLLFHALLLASATAAVAVDNATGGGNSTANLDLCNGAGCEPPAQPLPIYGYPPPSPSLPSKPPCPPVPVVCCGGGGGAAGQNTPQQPYYYVPPTGYLPYYNSASPPVLLAPVTFGFYVTVVHLLLCAMV